MRWSGFHVWAILPVAALALAAPVAPDNARLPGSLPETETLQYSVEWRLINAGKARLIWNAQPERARVNVHVESTGLVSKLFRVNDDYIVNVRPGLCTVDSYMKSEEGRRRRETRVTYDGDTHKADYLEKDLVRNAVLKQDQIEIPSCVHDVVGGLYHLRTLHLEPGEHTQVAVSDGKKSVMARVEAQQREEIKTPCGTYKTVRYEIFLFDNVLYRRSGHLYVWLSDDARRLPVQIRVRLQFTIGTITLQLEKEDRG